MFQDILFTFLISLSPFGEARAGIPYGELNGLPIILVFIIGLTANLLVFPLFYKGIELSNKYLWKSPLYRKGAIYLSARARLGRRARIHSTPRASAWRGYAGCTSAFLL